MSLFAQIKTEGKYPSDFANVVFESENIIDAFHGQTSIKSEPSNFSPVVVIKQEPQDIYALENTEQPKRSTTQMPITNTFETNDIKYEDISDVIALQALIKQDPSNSIEHDDEVILDWENTKQRSPPHINEYNDSSRHVELDSVSNYDSFKSKKSSLITKRSKREYLPYNCKLCDKAFKSLSHLNDHESYHLLNEPFPCHECPMSFICKQHLIDHSFVHSDERKFQCKQCDESFHTKTCLTSHELSHADAKPFQCHLCPKMFKNIKLFNEHETAHFNETPYPCDMCEKSFKKKSHLAMHQVVHSNNAPFQCKQCDKSFKWKTSLTIHEQTHFVPERFMCHPCDISFPNRITLDLHKQYHSIEKRYTCVMCEKSFDLKSELRLHMALHSENRSFQNNMCEGTSKDNKSNGHSENQPYNFDNCDKSFKGNYDVNIHKPSIHKFSQNKSLLSVEKEIEEECQPDMDHETIVGMEFDDVTDAIERQISIKQVKSSCSPVLVIKQNPEDTLALKNAEPPRSTTEKAITNTIETNVIYEHQVTNANDQLFQCNQCGKWIRRKDNLKKHERTHAVSERYQCHLCVKKFRCEKSLNVHFKYHSNLKRYPCDQCEKSFDQKSRLSSHKATHSEGFIFKCNMCEKSFKYPSALQLHLLCHSENRPFNCDICKKSFKRKTGLDTHIRALHNLCIIARPT